MKIKNEIVHIYVRCSTDKQIENSIQRQIDEGIKYSKKMGMDYKIYNDEGKSGIKSYENNREQLQNLLWEIEIGNVEYVWVETYDRITRNFEDGVRIDTLIVDNDLKLYEGLHSNYYEPKDITQKLVKTIRTIIGTEEKNKEIQKSIKGKIRKWESGDWCRGNIVFGYKKVDGKLLIDKEESKWVKIIYLKFSEGKSLEQIRRYLKSYGIKTKMGNDWSSESIRISLSLPEYIGKSYYTDKTKDPHRRNPKKFPYEDESKWIKYEMDVPKIINDDLYQKVQNKLTKSKLKSTKYEYFLHGKLECKCGSQWVGRMKSRVDRGRPDEFYYQCSNTDKWYHRNRSGREHLHQKGICNKPKRINTSDLDEMVWNKFLETLSKSSFLKEKIKDEVLGGKYETSSTRKKVNRELKRLNKEITQLKNSRMKLLKERFLLELSDSEFREIDLSIGVEIGKLREEYDKQISKEDFIERRGDWLDWISHFKTEINEYSKVTDMKKRRRILDSHVTKIKVNYYEETKQHDIKIHFKIPIVNDKIEYVKNPKSKMKWDKWGNSYRVNKGDNVISLSSLKCSNNGVGKPYSTVTLLAKFLG